MSLSNGHGREESKMKEKKKKSEKTLPRESKHEKLTFILKRKEDEVKPKPLMYRSLDSLAFRRNSITTDKTKEKSQDVDMKELKEKVEEITKYSRKNDSTDKVGDAVMILISKFIRENTGFL